MTFIMEFAIEGMVAPSLVEKTSEYRMAPVQEMPIAKDRGSPKEKN